MVLANKLQSLKNQAEKYRSFFLMLADHNHDAEVCTIKGYKTDAELNLLLLDY